MRPTVGERIPREPRMYQIIPWEHTKTGDFLKHIEPDVSVSNTDTRVHSHAAAILCLCRWNVH